MTSTEAASGLLDGGPEFWFGNDKTLWFAHFCKNRDRQYSLPEVIYEVVTDPVSESVTVKQPITCNDCGLHGRIEDGRWIELKSRHADG